MRIRELRDGLEVEDDEREQEGSWGGGGDGEVVVVVRLRREGPVLSDASLQRAPQQFQWRVPLVGSRRQGADLLPVSKFMFWFRY